MDILYIPFGYLLKLCCTLAGNQYVLALLFFALIMQIVLFPLGIKQQKASVNMQKIKPKEQIIREKYKGRTDRPTQMKMTQEIQDLYQREGVSQFSGCLPLLIQLPLIIILFAVVRYPLQYCVALGEGDSFIKNQYTTAVNMLEEAKDSIKESEFYADPAKDQEKFDQLNGKIKEYAALQKTFGANVDDNGNWDKGDLNVDSLSDAYAELKLVSFMQRDSEKFETELKDNYGIENAMKTEYSADVLDTLPAFDFIMGYSFLDIPWDFLDDGFVAILVMFAIPLLVFLSSYFGGVFSRKFSAVPQTNADGTPAPGTGKFMTWGMPAISTYFSMTFPLAIGAYWIFRTILQAIQQYILSKMYPLPEITEEELAEARRMYKAKKKKVITIEVDEDDTTYDNLIIDTKSDEAKNSPASSGKIVMLTGDEPCDPPKSEGTGAVEKAKMKDDDGRK